jgi:hypothetical protein
LKRFVVNIIMALSVLSYLGCAALPVGRESTGAYNVSDISKGLPTEGLWRENTALVDMDGDGYLDIVAPPPRKAEADQNRPFIFLQGKDGIWREGKYTFPKASYGYGGVAAGDINADGYPDIVLAVHSGKIMILQNNKSGGFAEMAFTVPEKTFQSRAVEIADINGDGWPDIVALSESSYGTAYKPQGLLIGINKGGKDWDIRMIEDSRGWFGDSFAVGDIAGAGKKDIAVATLAVKEGKKSIWFGDGKGDFKSYQTDIAVNTMPMIARVGDLDGDGKDEVVFMRSTLGRGAFIEFSVLKWNGDGFRDLSAGLEKVRPIAFDLADIDGIGTKELVVLSEDGIHLFRYHHDGWTEIGQYPLSPDEAKGSRDLRVGKNKDGSFLIVYNLGDENPSFHHGLRAYTLKVK